MIKKNNKTKQNKTERLRLLKEPQHHLSCVALTVIHVTSTGHRVGKPLWGRKSQVSIAVYKGWWQTD